MTQHTPGPWKAEGFENLTVNSAAGYTIVAAPGSDTGTRIEMKANAALIAAAPELLAAVKAFARWESTTMDDDELREVFQACYQAIAKAEGKE